MQCNITEKNLFVVEEEKTTEMWHWWKWTNTVVEVKEYDRNVVELEVNECNRNVIVEVVERQEVDENEEKGSNLIVG